MKKILVTGASGFVGRAFMHRFAGRPDIRLYGIGRRQHPDLPPSVAYASIDLARPFELDFDPDVVIHAAARASPWGTAREYRQQNIDATRHVVDFCQRKGHPRLVYISSSSVFYRHEHQFGLTEDSSIGPGFVNRYAASKYAGELLVGAYPGEKTILRPRAVFGPGDTVLFPRILAAARKGRLPRLVPEGKVAVGDVIYIDALCDYMIQAATLPNIAPAYNLTNAQPVEIEAFLMRLLRLLDLPVPVRQIKVRSAMRAAWWIEWLYRGLCLPGEPPVTQFGISVFAWSKTFDVTRALTDFGAPSVTLDEGVTRFIEWQSRQESC